MNQILYCNVLDGHYVMPTDGDVESVIHPILEGRIVDWEGFIFLMKQTMEDALEVDMSNAFVHLVDNVLAGEDRPR